MKTLPPDLEALMPEPFATMHDDGYWSMEPGTEPHESRYVGWRQEVFTADQVREAMQAAAKLERQAVHAALRHAGLTLIRTEHGLSVMKAITDAEAEAVAMHEGGGKTP